MSKIRDPGLCLGARSRDCADDAAAFFMAVMLYVSLQREQSYILLPLLPLPLHGRDAVCQSTARAVIYSSPLPLSSEIII